MTKKLSIEIPDGEYDHFIEYLEASPFNLQYEELQELQPICPSIIKFNTDIGSIGTDISDLDTKVDRIENRFTEKFRDLQSAKSADISTKKQIEPAVREIVEQILYEKKQFGD